MKSHRIVPRCIFFGLWSIIVCSSFAGTFTKHVNTFVGTDGHGHTFPGAAVPFGMVQLSPDTRVEGWDACGGYHYSDSAILGFSHTHLSGTGVADYGDILLMPTVGEVRINNYASRFYHQTEHASPGYYSVMLETYRIAAELTASTRVGVHRYTFPQSDTSNIVINLQHGLGPDQVIESSIQIINDHEITGFRRSTGWAKDQHLYFVAQFSKPFTSSGISINDTIFSHKNTASGINVKGYVQFPTIVNESVIVKVGISSVSVEGARNNIQSEVPGWDFDNVKSQADRLWENELTKISVDGEADDQRTTFYTALYHVLLTPNTFSDADGAYRGMDGKIHSADGFIMYTIFSLWDTFRAEHPLLTIIDRKRTGDFIKSLLAKYEQSGILPVWELACNETWCMIGYHSVPVIVDAYMKGIRNFNADEALTAMMHSAELDHFGLKYYKQYGYIPGEKEAESVSKTLEYAYDDWCIGQMAQVLGKQADASQYFRRAQSYKNIFDPLTHFMRPVVNGMWDRPFDPTSVTNHYTEANSWQYSFFAPHDIDGLIELYGGRDRFIERLDSLFNAKPKLTGRQQADISGLIGQYAQGNEPSHHVAYLYNYAGSPWKTQEITRRIMDSLFTPKPDGLCGNDDCGQMSAWYVMSAMGFYQVTPGQPIYCLSSPLFAKVVLSLENGKQCTIEAESNSREHKYIQSAALNGEKYEKSFIHHDDIMNGSSIHFSMASEPNTQWATNVNASPHSLPLDPIVTVPYIATAGKIFKDSLLVTLSCNTEGVSIYYTIDGELPTVRSSRYTSPFTLKNSATVQAFASNARDKSSQVVQAEFVQHQPVGTLKLFTQYAEQYSGGGAQALIDGIHGENDFRLGAWQGYEGTDLDAVIDLGSIQEIHEVSLGCLQDINSWIFFPTQAAFSFSEDSITWNHVVVMQNEVSPRENAIATKQFHERIGPARTRYVRVRANSIGKCPEWHKGAGNNAWLFVDEIIVK